MPGMMKGSMYKKGGPVKKYQQGGSVMSLSEPEGDMPMKAGTMPDTDRKSVRRGGLRSSMANANRRLEANRTARKEAEALADTGDMGGLAFKKGGMVKKKAGGMIGKPKGKK